MPCFARLYLFTLLVTLILVQVQSEDEEDDDGVEQPRGRKAAKYRNIPLLLPEGYDPLIIPSRLAAYAGRMTSAELDDADDEPLEVTVRISIKRIVEIEEMEEKITTSISLILHWQDWFIRAANEHNLTDPNIENDVNYMRTLDPAFLQRIWTPDLYLARLHKVTHAELMAPKITVRFHPLTGRVSYMSRLRTSVDCEMDFHYYPAETHKCDFIIRSTAHDNSEMRLVWQEPLGVYLDRPEESNFFVQLSNYTSYIVHERLVKERPFDGLRFTLLARRKLSYHMVQTFLPSLFFIIITWLCFLVPSSMVEARIGITMTTLLTLTAMFASVREGSPIVSYVRAIDIWMLACIFFVFLTLLEFTILLWLRRTNATDEQGTAEDESEMNEEQTCSNQVDESKCPSTKIDMEGVELRVVRKRSSSTQKSATLYLPSFKRRLDFAPRKNYAELIENHAFLIFSILFLVFNLIYWPWLLIGSKYVFWEVNTQLNAPEREDE